LLSEAQRPNVKFDDVIGAQNAKEELRYFINYLREPKKFLLGGNKPPQGVLLYGPPGTGKTMLAKAMAGESDVHFIQATASEFANKWVGESEANIRRLFRRARTYAPAIIFIDEIDAIGKERTGEDSNREAMLNTLLTEMQGFQGGDPNKPVFVLAATNFGVDGEGDGIGKLDEALVRRFDNRIKVDLPNEKERREYIKRQLDEKKVVIEEDVISNVAERTPGKSLAILQNIIDLAFRNAGKAEKPMNGNDLLNAMEDYEHGEQKEYSEAYYRSVAIHETGHAYVSYLGGDCPSYLTIESRANFGGYMQHANSEETPSYTKEELLARIRTALAGRAAEQVFYGREKALNTGASSDLKQASSLAFHIICTYGMEEDQYVVLSRQEILESSMAGEYIRQVNELLRREMENTLALIEDGKDVIRAIADELLKENHLTGEQFQALIRAYQTDRPQ
jgi:ATP-dependent metalloprotease FtsH